MKTTARSAAHTAVLALLLASAPVYAIPIGAGATANPQAWVRDYTQEVIGGFAAFATWQRRPNLGSNTGGGSCCGGSAGVEFTASVPSFVSLPPGPVEPAPWQPSPVEPEPEATELPPAVLPPSIELDSPVPPGAVPEPGSLALLGFGLAALRSRRSRAGG